MTIWETNPRDKILLYLAVRMVAIECMMPYLQGWRDYSMEPRQSAYLPLGYVIEIFEYLVIQPA